MLAGRGYPGGMESEYTYRVVKVDRVVDGDTYWVYLDVGFRQYAYVNIRLNGYDTPEARGPSDGEKAAANRAREFATSFLAEGCRVRTYKDPDSFGRWLADVYSPEGESLGALLARDGLASVWPSRWRGTYL